MSFPFLALTTYELLPILVKSPLTTRGLARYPVLRSKPTIRCAADGGIAPFGIAHVVRFAVACIAGAAFIHVVEFHLGLNGSGAISTRLAVASYMLRHCPVLGSVGVAVAACALAFLASIRSYRRDIHMLRRATAEARDRVLRRSPRRPVPWPRQATTWIALSAVQWVLFQLLMQVMPMTYPMRMNGALMAMPMIIPIPVAPLCIVVALVLGLILTRFEEHVYTIEALVAALIRLACSTVLELTQYPESITRPVLSRLLGPALFSRPPPQTA